MHDGTCVTDVRYYCTDIPAELLQLPSITVLVNYAVILPRNRDESFKSSCVNPFTSGTLTAGLQTKFLLSVYSIILDEKFALYNLALCQKLHMTDKNFFSETLSPCCQGHSDGGISVYIPPKSVYLTIFYVVTGCFFFSLTHDKFDIVPVCTLAKLAKLKFIPPPK